MIVSVRHKDIQIDDDTYRHLFDNSIYYDHSDYLESLKLGRISLSNLIHLARGARINYSLFFTPAHVVRTMIDKDNDRLFQGFGGNFTISTRGRTLNLNVVRMVIKDIKTKQSFIARNLKVPKNKHPRYLANSPRTLPEQADYILHALNIDIGELRQCKTKLAAMWYLIDKLEEQNINVSIEAQTNMPQNMRHAAGVAGVYIKDSRFPYLFVCNEGQANFGDGAGRKIFTIMYLVTCLFKGRSRLVALTDNISESGDGKIYQIVEEMLLPKQDLPQKSEYLIEDIDNLSDQLKVTSRAILVRLWHLEMIEEDNYWSLMSVLRTRYQRYLREQKRLREEGKKRFATNVSNNILAYHGKAYLKILKNLYANGKVTQRQINWQLSYGKQEIDTAKVFKKV